MADLQLLFALLSIDRQALAIFSLPSRIGQTQHTSIECWRHHIWIASNDYLWSFQPQRQWWQQFSYPADHYGGIISVGPKDNLWLDGMAYFDGQQWHCLPKCPIPLSFWAKTPQCHTWDSKGQPWLATVQGIYFFDADYQCWRLAPGKRLQRAYSLGCFQGEIWCSEYGDSLYKFSGNGWHKIACSQPRPKLEYAYALYPTPERLWFNTHFGVGSFDGINWVSHYDYSDYYKLHKLSLLTFGTVILVLLIGIIGLLLIGRLRKRNLAAPL